MDNESCLVLRAGKISLKEIGLKCLLQKVDVFHYEVVAQENKP